VLNFDEIWDNADMVIDYKPLPKFPAVSRDFSFVCDEDLEVGTIEEVMAKAAGKLCEGVALFDVFRGEKIGEGKKSVSFRVSMRASDRTLTVEEADKISAKIVKALDARLGIALRS
jgi:phenylalanyl-tRNA synthetase beta chain